MKHDLNLSATESKAAQNLALPNPNSLVVQAKNIDARRWSFASMHSTTVNNDNGKKNNKADQISIASDQFR